MEEQKYNNQTEEEKDVLDFFYDNVDMFVNDISKEKWKFISATGCVPDEILEEFSKLIDWDILSMTQKFTLEQLRKYEEHINYDVNFTYKQYTEEIYEEFIHVFRFKKFQNLNYSFEYTEKFVNKYKKYFNWTEYTFHHCKNWDMDFIEKYKEHTFFNILLNLRPELRTEEFVTKYKQYIDVKKVAVQTTDDIIYKLYRKELSPDQVAQLFLEKMKKLKAVNKQ